MLIIGTRFLFQLRKVSGGLVRELLNEVQSTKSLKYSPSKLIVGQANLRTAESIKKSFSNCLFF